jgi:adenylate kinase
MHMHRTPLHIVLIGPPGAGKSTVGQALAALVDIAVISTGVILRAEIQTGSLLGQDIARHIDTGDFVTDAMIQQVLEAQCSLLQPSQGIVLDGYPRNIAQAGALPALLGQFARTIDAVVLLDITDATALARLGGRRMCITPTETYPVHLADAAALALCTAQNGVLTIRPDDAPDIIAHRLTVYHRNTAPLIAYYQQQGLLRRVDASADPDAIARAILTAVTTSSTIPTTPVS